jgi:hypothetical protein
VIDAQSVLAARSPGASQRAARLALAVGDAPRLSGQLEDLLARRVSTRRATALKGYGALPSSGCEERTAAAGFGCLGESFVGSKHVYPGVPSRWSGMRM